MIFLDSNFYLEYDVIYFYHNQIIFMVQKESIIVWFRRDLRVIDHPSLYEAIKSGLSLVPTYIFAPEEEGDWPLGAASRWWLHYSLQSLNNDLKKLHLSLIIRKGSTVQCLKKLVQETKASKIVWSRCYDPTLIEQEKRVENEFQDIETQSFNSSLLFEPWEVTRKGKPYQIFTPFWKACLLRETVEKPLPVPKIQTESPHLQSLKIEELKLLPSARWDTGLEKRWTPGTKGALKLLREFLKERVFDYGHDRDYPAIQTSLLSPHLHFGEISPKIIWYKVSQRMEKKESQPHLSAYLRQLCWREFAYHLLYHFPQSPSSPLRDSFNHFPWKKNKKHLEAWQKGMTGYPIVDAGMRELWHTGWMHNRVRMIVGSFLVKDLLISWLEGAKWFWDTLVDADLANNSFGWQWVGGCGKDCLPFFRIFNPMIQGKKFDPQGEYVRTWVPELRKLPNKWIHYPWEAPQEILEMAEIKLGITYPGPILDHTSAREEALKVFKSFVAM